MEKLVALSHEFSTLPTLVYLLVAIGVVLSALFLYLMRISDRARAEDKKIREYLDPIDFFVELIFAACSGYSGFFIALHFGMGITGIVMTSHAAAYLNRPIYLLIRRYGDAIMGHLGVQVANTGGDSAALLREQKIQALEMQLVMETRVEEQIRIRALIDDLRAGGKKI